MTVVSELNPDWVQALQTRSGKDIWIFGGSGLFRSFLDSGHVDTIEVNVIPVLLGGGVPLLPPPYNPAKLRLLSHKIYRSGRAVESWDVHWRRLLSLSSGASRQQNNGTRAKGIPTRAG